MSKRILCLLAPGFEEIETITPVDLLRRAGAEVVLASLRNEDFVTGRSGIAVRAETSLDSLATDIFDMLLIPGGPGVQVLREDGRAAALAREFYNTGRFVAAICAGPTVLLDAGLLEGVPHTSHFSVRDELPPSRSDERVVRADRLITSRGAGTAVDFGLILVESLYGPEGAARIAAAIMA